MKIIGIKVESLGRAEWAVETLKTAVEHKRVTLDDIAFVTKDEEGKVQLHQTGDITVRKGAKRGRWSARSWASRRRRSSALPWWVRASARCGGSSATAASTTT